MMMGIDVPEDCARHTFLCYSVIAYYNRDLSTIMQVYHGLPVFTISKLHLSLSLGRAILQGKLEF